MKRKLCTAVFEAPGIGPNGQSNTAHWQTALFTSLILRDDATSRWLCTREPLQAVHDSPTRSAPYAYALVMALAGFRDDQDDWVPRARAALEQAQAEVEVAEYAQAFAVPLLKMLLAIYEGPAPFNAALVDALEAHQRYYTTGTRNNDPRGFVALGPAGAVQLGL